MAAFQHCLLEGNRIVLFLAGRYNRTPQSRQLLNNQRVFLMVLKAEESKAKAPEDLGSGEGCFLILSQPSSRCVLNTGQKGLPREVPLWGPFYKAANPKGPTS